MEKLPQTDVLAQQIQRHHDEAQRCAGEAVEHARQAGEALLKAKAEIGHGKFQEWFQAAGFTFSDRAARGYMRVARELPKLPEEKRQRVADLSLRDAMKAISKPAKTDKPVKGITKPSSKPKADPVKVYDKAAAMLPDLDGRGCADLAVREIALLARDPKGNAQHLRRIDDNLATKLDDMELAARIKRDMNRLIKRNCAEAVRSAVLYGAGLPEVKAGVHVPRRKPKKAGITQHTDGRIDIVMPLRRNP